MQDAARRALVELSATRGDSLAALSQMIRRNPAYLQQFVTRGTPRRLAEADRRLLAVHFDIDEAVLGGPSTLAAETVAVPWLDVAASAGPGRAAIGERVLRAERFAPHLLREAGVAPGLASLIDAVGDSMEPGILDGDRLLVDRGDVRLTGVAGIFVLRRDDMLSVKRVAWRSGGRELVIASDNPDHATIVVPGNTVTVIGRVKLLLRKLD